MIPGTVLMTIRPIAPFFATFSSLMYKNLEVGDINNVERCYNVEKIINRYYPEYEQKCCLDDNLMNHCYSCKITKKYYQ